MKETTKKVRNLRRRVRNHAIDGLRAVIDLAQCDKETDLIQLTRVHHALREAVIVCREVWPTPEHVGIKMLGPGSFTVGN